MDISRPEIEFALSAVRQASLLAAEVQRQRHLDTVTKGDLSPVTVADYAAQALIGQIIDLYFPDDPLVGEENSAALLEPENAETLAAVTSLMASAIGEVDSAQVCRWIDRGEADPADRFWTLDPIDGTKGFLRGDQFAVALALLEGGEVRLGVLGCPNLGPDLLPDLARRGTLIVAARGEGSWALPLEGDATPVRLHVSGLESPASARLFRSYEAGHTNVSQVDQVAEDLGVRAEPVRMDSQAKYAMLASGQGEVLMRLLSPAKPNYREKIWDQAAGAVIVEEAGGQITDLWGNPLDFSAGKTLARNRGVLATNGVLHERFLKSVKKVAHGEAHNPDDTS